MQYFPDTCWHCGQPRGSAANGPYCSQACEDAMKPGRCECCGGTLDAEYVQDVDGKRYHTICFLREFVREPTLPPPTKTVTGDPFEGNTTLPPWTHTCANVGYAPICSVTT